MTSEVEICRMALSHIGKDGIDSLTEASAEARACNRFYTLTRDVLLQSYPWRFATKTQALANVTNDKKGAWGFAYTIPNDSMKIRWIRPEYSETDPKADDPNEPYELEAGLLYCNLQPAFLRYIWRVTDPARFSPMFQELLAVQLAVRLAMPLTRDPKVRADCFQWAKVLQGQTEAADANESRNTTDHASEQVEARA